MTFALKSKKRAALLLALLAAVLLFALPATAEEALSFSLSVDPASLTQPGPVTVSLRVGNNTDADLTEPVSMQDPDGQIVTAFGDGGQALIKQGEFITAQQIYNVTQAQLNDGKLTYTLSYNEVDENGEVVVQTLAKSAAIAYTGTNVDLTVNRTIDPEVVRSGKTVNVQYELYNAGNVEIKNIRVRENSSVSGSAQTVAALAPGERKTIQFTATMGSSAMTSAGRVTYTAGEQTNTISLPEVEIPRANPGLELGDFLSADKTAITNGETVTLTMSIKNNGNITYSNISVNDETYGELFTNLTLGPGETLTREKQFTLDTTTAFKYTVTLPDNTGTTNTVTSNEVKVSVYDPSQVLVLTLVADSDTQTISSAPADVAFTLTVTNNSAFEAQNIRLSHGATAIYTVEKLAPTESVTITRNFSVSQAGKFRFTATAKDALDNTVSFDSNEIALTYAAPVVTATMAPIPTVAPLITVTPAPIEVLEPVKLQTNQLLRTAAYVLGGLFAASFLLFLISTVARAKKRSDSKNAYDHMELGEKRDYTEPSKYPVEMTPAEEELAAISRQEKAEAEELPSDSILKEEAPAAAQGSDDGAGYRLTREDSTAFDTPAPAVEPREEAEAQPARHRRAGRRSGEGDAPSEDE
ncbi:MAG: hypothetical protein IJ157_06945 [Clostridia bacterium]|nr:hypothetical protein [Clostridia bacterium]